MPFFNQSLSHTPTSFPRNVLPYTSIYVQGLTRVAVSTARVLCQLPAVFPFRVCVGAGVRSCASVLLWLRG